MLAGTALEFLGRRGPARRVPASGHLDDRPDTAIRTDEAFALEQDAADPLAPNRDRFHLPVGPDGSTADLPRGAVAGGPAARPSRAAVEAELDAWAPLGRRGPLPRGRRRGSRTTSPCASRPRGWSAPGRRGRDDEHADRQPAPAAGVVLPAARGTDRRSSSTRRRSRPTATRWSRSCVHHGLDPAEHLVVVGPRAGRGDRPDRGPRGRHPRRTATRSPWPCWPASTTPPARSTTSRG